MNIKGPSHPCKSHWPSSWFEKQCQHYAVLQPGQMHQDLQEQWDLLWPKQQLCVDDCHYSANTGWRKSEIHFLLVEREGALWLLCEIHFHLQYCLVCTSPKQEKKYSAWRINFQYNGCFHFHMFTVFICYFCQAGENLFTFYPPLWEILEYLYCMMRQF